MLLRLVLNAQELVKLALFLQVNVLLVGVSINQQFLIGWTFLVLNLAQIQLITTKLQLLVDFAILFVKTVLEVNQQIVLHAT